MRNRKLIGWLLIIAPLFMIIGMIFNNHILWFIADSVVIITCFGSGLYLLRKKE